MKITKAQIQKMIKEELEALEEQGPTGPGSYDIGGVQNRGGGGAFGIDSLRRKKPSPEEIARRERENERTAANVRVDQVKIDADDDKIKADREAKQAALQKDLEQHQSDRKNLSLYGMINKRYRAAEKDLSGYNRVRAQDKAINSIMNKGELSKIKQKIEFAKGLIDGYEKDKVKDEKNYPKFLQTMDYLFDINSKGELDRVGESNKSYFSTELFLPVFQYADRLEDNMMRQWKQAEQQAQKEKKRAMALIPKYNKLKKKGLFGLGFLGLEENLALTVEELQKIIEEEYENVTKGK